MAYKERNVELRGGRKLRRGSLNKGLQKKHAVGGDEATIKIKGQGMR